MNRFDEIETGYVTGFDKTRLPRTRTEIQFMA